MRLLCELEDGTLLDMDTAIRQQPYDTRSLLSDALFSCCGTLPDSMELLKAEQSLRDTLSEFAGDQDKYVRNYILTRALDHRTQTTPRAPLISSSLQIGGPIALIGVFYATLDAHRNQRNRANLDCFCNSLSELSKHHLFKKANSFVVNPSLKGWFNRILDKLGLDSLSVACLLYCLGLQAIPRSFFTQCRSASRLWGPDGEIHEAPPRIASLLQDQPCFEASLHELEMIGLIKASVDTIRVNERLIGLLEDRPQILAWKVEALRAVCQSYLSLGPFRQVTCISNTRIQLINRSDPDRFTPLLPLLGNALSHLSHPLVLPLFLQKFHCYDAIEVCLSASSFRGLEWKREVIEAALRLAAAGPQDPIESALISARLHTRQLCLSHLASAAPLELSDAGLPSYPSSDARSLAYSVDLVLWKIHNYTRQQHLDSASKELSSLAAPIFASALGKAQTAKLELAHGVILHFQGRFIEAYEILRHLPPTNSKVLSHLSAVMCEMRQCDRAITRLEGWLQVSMRPHSRASRRIKLALANAWLLKTLFQTSESQDKHAMYSTGLETANRLYGELQESQGLDWLDIVSISVGYAMAKHISLQIEPAIDAWRHVRHVSRKYGMPVGYTDMVSAYSLSDLECKRGGVAESDIYARQAKEIFSSTGKQYHFTGLGTIWLDILTQWFSASGRESNAIA